MDISAKLTNLSYKASCLTKKMKEVKYENFNINSNPTRFILKSDEFTYSVSRWVSPKRTRSYPYERVYDTLTTSNKCITVIPIIKDEGANGDRDYLQWDTISLMSLFDVYVILAYYDDAEKHRTRNNKITKQKFNNAYVKQKIEEISHYKSSALHWNLNEMQETFLGLIDKVQKAYTTLGRNLDVEFHSETGIDKFKEKISKGVEDFKYFSRNKARDAQSREKETVQPKEALSSLTKATITITNYLGGEYFFTTDEIDIQGDTLFLIEGKHTHANKIPSLGDIKDGLLKLMLYTNLENLKVGGEYFHSIPVLKLTSENISGSISSNSAENEITTFLSKNSFSKKEIKVINEIFKEACKNNFIAVVEQAAR